MITIKGMVAVLAGSLLVLIWLCHEEIFPKSCWRRIWFFILKVISLCGEGMRVLDNKCSCDKPVPNPRVKSHCDLCSGNIKKGFGL